jgi:hypothetical protein
MLEHPCLTVYPSEIDDIFSTLKNADKSLKTIDIWVSLVENHASRISAGKKSEEEKSEAENNFKGDMLELLAEIFFKNSPFDDRFGLRDYTVADCDSDYGVDATGVNVNGHKCAVQCKYRANPNPKGDDQIKYEDLAKTYCDGRKNHACDLDKPNTIFLFTTANGYSFHIDKQFKKELVFLGRNQLSEILHKNINFWNLAYEQILME